MPTDPAPSSGNSAARKPKSRWSSVFKVGCGILLVIGALALILIAVFIHQIMTQTFRHGS
jgi:hypothetical protein